MNRHTPWGRIITSVDEWHPGFAGGIVGAAEREIGELAEAVGRPLLPEYHGFLEHMGRSMGGLTIAAHDFSLETVLDMYGAPSWQPPAGLLLIGDHQDEDRDFDFCLSLEEVRIGRVLRVSFSFAIPEGGGVEDMTASHSEPEEEALSLQALVLVSAFEQFKLRSIARPRTFVRDEDVHSDRSPELIDAVLREFGFRKHGLSDAWTSFYERDNAALMCRRPFGTGVQFRLAARDERLVRRFAMSVKTELDMRSP
jgi:hypothetical protein